jgi:hypothetical protein
MGGILLKLIYSALLLGLSTVLLRELWTVWFDPQIYIGRFEVVSETGKDEEAGAAFAKRIVSAQAIIGRQLMEYQTHSGADAPTDATYLLPGTAPLLLPPKALEGVDVTIQSVNLSQLLTVVRKGFLAPNEVRGHVTIREGSILTAVDWPRAPRSADRQPPLTQFLTPSKGSVQEAAAYVACSISWARARSAKVTFSRAQFCDFATALGDLYALGGKASNPGGLSATEAALVRMRAAQLRTHYGSDIVFAELYRLRADLLDLLPEGVRTQSELVEAQEDRVRYAMLSPKLRDLPEEERRLRAQALARPAILLEPGKPLQAPENWKGLLGRNETAIRAAEASTGLILHGDGSAAGTGFIVAPGLVMTATFVLDAFWRTPSSVEAEQPVPPRLCLGPSETSCEPALTIGDIVYRDEESHIIIANLESHDAVLHPPLPLSAPLPEANTLIGRYVFVVGYPYPDARMPEDFVRLLLGETKGHRRVMPGRILAFGAGSPPAFGNPESKRLPVFTTDISTSGGTGGGPLVDLTTGAVLGMSHSGRWQGERGKFAYAQPIPRAAVDLISRQLRGEEHQPPPTRRTKPSRSAPPRS